MFLVDNTDKLKKIMEFKNGTYYKFVCLIRKKDYKDNPDDQVLHCMEKQEILVKDWLVDTLERFEGTLPDMLKYTELLLKNSKKSDWTARYFAAQTYIKIYDIKKEEKYLKEAYEIVKDSINNGLIAEQQKLNSTYLAEVKEVIIPENNDYIGISTL